MKHLIKVYIIALVIGFCPATSSAQEVVKGMKQIFDITLDENGKGTVEVFMKLNASQWDVFKEMLGNNPYLLKREMQNALPKYFLTDFEYQEKSMDRSYTLKFKVPGFSSLAKGDKWNAPLDSKDPDILKLSDREYVLTQDLAVGNGVLAQQTMKIHLPSNTSESKMEKDSFGKAVLTYSTSPDVAQTSIIGLGILLMLGGGFFFFRNRKLDQQGKMKVDRSVRAA